MGCLWAGNKPQWLDTIAYKVLVQKTEIWFPAPTLGGFLWDNAIVH